MPSPAPVSRRDDAVPAYTTVHAPMVFPTAYETPGVGASEMLAVERRISTRSAGTGHVTVIPPVIPLYVQVPTLIVAGAVASTIQLTVVGLVCSCHRPR